MFSKGFMKRFSRIPDLGDTYANGESRKLIGLHQGAQGRPVEVLAFGQRDTDEQTSVNQRNARKLNVPTGGTGEGWCDAAAGPFRKSRLCAATPVAC